jgi:dTDP-glucose 4,6-dehydratase
MASIFKENSIYFCIRNIGDIKMKNLLVTGGAGFIGSNFVKYMLDKHPDMKVINVDALTYAGNLENLKDVAGNSNYTFIRADIRDRDKMNEIFTTYDIDAVVNMAAESHVDRSIVDPDAFLTTNIIGTQVLLDTAKKHWKVNPEDKYCKDYKPGVRFLQVSTDEVYGALGEKGKFVETMPLQPNNPYSASKASADLIVRSYHKTFGMPVNITRCSNNYGPYQFPEKLIPLMINNCLNNKELPVYGDGMQIRDWLHVADHCSAIDTVLHKGLDGEIYNIGGNNEKANIEIVKLIIQTLGKSEKLIKYVKDRPGHDRRYAIDNTKITTQLGWKPAYTSEQGIKETIEWYLENTEWIENVVSGDYVKYYDNMYSVATVGQ